MNKPSITILAGDLNYRVNYQYDECIKVIKDKNIQDLLKNDQLNIEKNSGRILNEFEEGEIKFLPTYKYDIGTNNYDTSEKKRIPAYTDRIFYKKNNDVKLISYDSHDDFLDSDHKPVSAVFDIIVFFHLIQ
jgi:endonuclease/exonuclease/phosphatase family metal-dependent hydrolase